MRLFLVSCLLALATAAPQGYNYQHQATSFVPPPPPQTYLPSAGAPGQYSGGAAGPLGHTQQAYSQSAYSQVGAQSVGGQQYAHQAQHQPDIVTKNFYIHSAPEDQEDEALSQQLGGGPIRKNYRVVFIKAPSQSSSAAALQLAQSQNEEKTVIYVLSKKTDVSDLQASLDAHPTQPSKPEVFFIKYKTPEEAQHAQHQIQAQYDSLGGGPTHVSDEGIAPVQSFIGALGDSSHAHHDGLAGGHHAGHAGHAGHGGIGGGNAYLPPSY